MESLKKNEMMQIFKLAWPVMLGMVLQSFLSTVDVYFISNLGTDQSAAASLSNSIINVIFVFSTLVSAGAIALIARSKGEGNTEAVKRFSGESIMLSGLIGFILSILCFVLRKDMLVLIFNPSETVLNYANEYLSVMYPGTILVFLNSALRTIFQAEGDTRIPLYIFGASNIVNAAGDYLFVNVLGFGISGSAWATVISMALSFIAISVILIKRLYDASFKNFLNHMKLCMEDSIRILKIGGWACLQNLARPITGTLMYSLIYLVGGEEGAAAFGIGAQLLNYTFIILVGLSTGLAIMVGHSLGRGDIHGCDSLIKTGMRLAWINIVIFAIPYVLFPNILVGIFIKDPMVIQHGVEYLQIIYMGILTVPFSIIYSGVFQGAGDTFPPMVASMVANVVFKLPIAYLLAIPLGLKTLGPWIAIALSIFIEAAIIVFYFRKGKWKEKKI